MNVMLINTVDVSYIKTPSALCQSPLITDFLSDTFHLTNYSTTIIKITFYTLYLLKCLFCLYVSNHRHTHVRWLSTFGQFGQIVLEAF